MFIFIFTIATAGMVMVSFWLNSLSNTFVAATNKSKLAQNTEVSLKDSDKKMPSLMSNMKANIKDASSIFSDLYSDHIKSDNGEKKQSIDQENKRREIKPVRLPVDKQ